MNADYAELKSDDCTVALFLSNYHRIWQRLFPDLIKRAHWHTIFSARCSPDQRVSCRTLHRTLYGAYGTDIRTCIERVKDCERDGFVRIVDAAGVPCPVSAAGFIVATDKLRDSFDRHAVATINEVCRVFGDRDPPGPVSIACGDAAITAIFGFFEAYDEKWRKAGDFVVRKKGLTIAHIDDSMNHLVTYQYWAVVMLLWSTSAFGRAGGTSPALVIDEINSKMWDALKLGHLAIKERVDNLIRWGFFAEQTIKKHKAVSLTLIAGEAVSRSLAESLPLLRELHRKIVPEHLAAAAN